MGEPNKVKVKDHSSEPRSSQGNPEGQSGNEVPAALTRGATIYELTQGERAVMARLTGAGLVISIGEHSRQCTALKAERDRLREHNARLIAAVEAALDYCSSEAIGTVQQEIADNQRMQETLRAALEPQGETP